jgi:hypothetical protein
MSKTNTGSNKHTHTSSPGSTGKLRFHLVGRLEKGVNS